MGIFGKNDPEVVKIRGVKIGPPARSDGLWTKEDKASWILDEDGYPTGEQTPLQCDYVGGIVGRCKSEAMSGNARCSRHQGKISK